MHQGLKEVLKYYEIRNGQLCINGEPVSNLVKSTGSPLYLYDLGVAQQKYQMLRSALPDDVEIHYAIKANPHPDVVRCFVELGCGVDVASKGELEIALKSGVKPDLIGFAGPGKRIEELEAACQANIGSLNVESEQELELANSVAGKLGVTFNVALRINTAFELVASGMRMGGGAKAFGIDEEKIPSLLSGFSDWPHLNFVGFHIFSGSQNLNHEFIATFLEKTFSMLENLLPYCPYPPTLINLGGGFGIPYFSNDSELNIQAVGQAFKHILKAKQQVFSKTKFIVESGRYLIGEAGLYIAEVLYRKESRGEIFLVLNGGMNHQLAASGNLGQIIKKPYPICLIDRMDENNLQKTNVVGPLCTPIDTFGKKIDLPEARVGDLLAIFCSGAYGYTSSPLEFLGRNKAKERVIK